MLDDLLLLAVVVFTISLGACTMQAPQERSGVGFTARLPVQGELVYTTP